VSRGVGFDLFALWFVAQRVIHLTRKFSVWSATCVKRSTTSGGGSTLAGVANAALILGRGGDWADVVSPQQQSMPIPSAVATNFDPQSPMARFPIRNIILPRSLWIL
jgi:hypothetical protein